MKVSTLYIHSFRGIPNELTVDFTTSGKAMSTIIFGDNGSGKSTIIDALEFNLQGRICRTTVINNIHYTSPISFKYSPIIGAETKVIFDNGTVNNRGIDVVFKSNETSIRCDNKFLHKDFSLAPIVLRRNDIISYNMMPREKRQILFLSFLYSQYIKMEEVEKNGIYWENDPYITNLKEQYISLKKQRRDEVSKLAQLCKVKSNKVPFSSTEKLNAFVHQYLNIKGFKNVKGKRKAQYFSETPEQRLIRLSAEKIQVLNEQLKEVSTEAEKKINPNNYGVLIDQRKSANAAFINKASEYLKDSFKEVANIDYVDDIELEIGDATSASFEILVRLKNGKVTPPNRIFSEGNYDLLVLLLYVSLIRSCVNSGQQPVLILDDTLQSIDSTVRVRFMHYIVKACKNWQLIITCHDELWLNQLKYIFNLAGHPFKELRTHNWSFDRGPQIETVTKTGEDKSLLEAIGTNNKHIIASQAGVFLENICQKLSVSIPTSVHRVEGDKYTIGDLWPGIKKVLVKTELKELAEQLDLSLQVRNMLGCHANEWAAAMSESEVLSFAKQVQDLYDKTFCKKCHSWITSRTCSGNLLAECKCRDTQYFKPDTK